MIPAGGRASRLSPLPFSKELFPIGFDTYGKEGELRAKVSCHYLLEKMRIAGITKTYIVMRKGKWDIPNYFSHDLLDMSLAYVVVRDTEGVPYTLDHAYPFVERTNIAFGFPDILFKPADAFRNLRRHLEDTDADIVLGLFPVERKEKWDIVETSEDGRICRVLVKPEKASSNYTWVIAVWTPAFTRFMNRYINSEESRNKEGELYLSDVIQAAIEHGLSVRGEFFDNGVCVDIGTTEDLIKAINEMITEIRGEWNEN